MDGRMRRFDGQRGIRTAVAAPVGVLVTHVTWGTTPAADSVDVVIQVFDMRELRRAAAELN